MSGRGPKARLVRRGGQRGYNLVEVMASLSLLIITSAGIVALQKVSIFGNMRAKQLAVANQIGRTWMERLRTDSVVWNYPSFGNAGSMSSDINETVWLNMISSPNMWFEPATNTVRNATAGADALGNDVLDLSKAQFCTHIKLNWMYPNEVMRADVRVVWLREGGQGPYGDKLCGFGNTLPEPLKSLTPPSPPDTMMSRYHAVYLSSSIVKNAAQ